MKKVILGVVSTMLVACTNGDGAVRVLQNAGYTDVKITGYRLFGCSEDDTFRTGFKAIGPNGKSVVGTVCSGFLKGATIRLD